MSEEILYDKSFRLEFDFFDVDTSGLEGRVVNLRKGKNAQYERQLGLEFVKISPTQARDVNRAIAAAAAV